MCLVFSENECIWYTYTPSWTYGFGIWSYGPYPPMENIANIKIGILICKFQKEVRFARSALNHAVEDNISFTYPYTDMECAHIGPILSYRQREHSGDHSSVCIFLICFYIKSNISNVTNCKLVCVLAMKRIKGKKKKKKKKKIEISNEY